MEDPWSNKRLYLHQSTHPSKTSYEIVDDKGNTEEEGTADMELSDNVHNLEERTQWGIIHNDHTYPSKYSWFSDPQSSLVNK